MPFGFSDIGSMFSKGMQQYGSGLDKMRALPMNQKMMAAGQILHGGVNPADMMGAAYKLGQPGAAPIDPNATPGAPPVAPPPVETAPAPAQDAQSHGSDLFMGLLPLLMKNGIGTGLLDGKGLGLLGGGAGGGIGGLLGKFGFGGH
jgi:hypothetical protein